MACSPPPPPSPAPQDADYDRSFARLVAVEKALGRVKASFERAARELCVAFHSAVRVANSLVELAHPSDPNRVKAALGALRAAAAKEQDQVRTLGVDAVSTAITTVVDGRLSAFPAVREAAATRHKLVLEASHYVTKNTALEKQANAAAADDKSPKPGAVEKRNRTAEKLNSSMAALTSQTQALKVSVVVAPPPP